MFFFNDSATTEIYTLSLHAALPIWAVRRLVGVGGVIQVEFGVAPARIGLVEDRRVEPFGQRAVPARSEEHTSELQSRQYLVCRLLLEKKKNIYILGKCHI